MLECRAPGKYAHAGSRTRVTSMGGLYDAATLHAPCWLRVLAGSMIVGDSSGVVAGRTGGPLPCEQWRSLAGVV